MSFDVRDERFHQAVDPVERLTSIASGFVFTEGPVWHPEEHYLIFSDIIGNTIYRWRQGSGLAVFRQPSWLANGNAFDRQARLISCEHGTSRLSRAELEQGEQVRYRVLATHYQGKQLNSPNDVVVHSTGAIYFTDPTSGRSERYGIPREPDLPFAGVYRLAPESGELILLVDDFAKPNGLCFSRDESRLFVNDTERRHIRVFSLRADGAIEGGRVWAETTGDGPGVPDGMKIDTADVLFCCGPGGVHLFAADATCLGVIRTPEQAANFCWGGADLRTLYITASTSVYQLRVKAPGVRAF